MAKNENRGEKKTKDAKTAREAPNGAKNYLKELRHLQAELPPAGLGQGDLPDV